jgi:hypothetical protein
MLGLDMTPKTFKGYGVNSADVTVILERITHYYPVEYNGKHGTCIVLETDKEVMVDEWPETITQAIADMP